MNQQRGKDLVAAFEEIVVLVLIIAVSTIVKGASINR